MANLDLARGRSTVLNLTNQTGATRSPGDVVIVTTANDESFNFSTSSNYATTQIGVVDETIGIGSNGRVVVEGYARSVNTGANTVSRGNWLYQSTTSGTGIGAGFATTGAFGQVLKGGSGTTPSAVIVPVLQANVAQTAAVSAGSNSTHVREISTAGASTTLWSPFDHAHAGVAQITSSSSNTLQRGTVNIRGGTGVGVTATDTDGDGEFDTITLSSFTTGGGGGGGGTTELLASLAYKRGSDGSIGNTTSTSLTDVDATNLQITFTAPASGHILVHVYCLVGVAAGGGGYIGLRESTTQVGTQAYLGSIFSNVTGQFAHVFDITSVSGGSHTYKLAHRNSGGFQSDVYGGPTFGDVVIEIWSAA